MVLLDRHRVRSARPHDPLERCIEVGYPVDTCIVGTVWEQFEEASSDSGVPLRGRHQIAVTDRHDSKIKVENKMTV